jgi:hypothetical protein
MRKTLVVAVVATLTLQTPGAVAGGQVILGISSPHGIPNQGAPVLPATPFQRFNRFPHRFVANGFCCFAPGQASPQVIVLQTPAAPPPPPQAAPPAPAYMPPSVERTSQGVTIIRGAPIPP